MAESNVAYQAVKNAHIRIARPTDQLDAVTDFYRSVLGFRLLSEFRDHDGIDGVMLGHPGFGYHLEFTATVGHHAGRAPTQDHLLVFYIGDNREWQATVDSIEAAGHSPVKSLNPWWDRQGRTYEDPDGYRIVIQNAEWPVMAEDDR